MEHQASQGPAPDDVEGLFAQGFIRSSSAFTNLAMGPNAKKLTPYIPRLLEVVSSGEVDHLPGMETHVFQALSLTLRHSLKLFLLFFFPRKSRSLVLQFFFVLLLSLPLLVGFVYSLPVTFSQSPIDRLFTI